MVMPNLNQATISFKTRRDFANELYHSCIQEKPRVSQAYSTQHSTWFSVLQAVFRSTDKQYLNEEQWISALSTSMLSNKIECLPGSHLAHITVKRVIRLVGSAQPNAEFPTRTNLLKRPATDLVEGDRRQIKKQKIDFGCPVPFITIPPLVELGFKKNDKIFGGPNGHPKILEHYHVARMTLEQCLGDPVCDVMLMMALTLASSSVTPAISVKAKDFCKGAQKDPALFAANLVTRMLWFLCPTKFPKDEDEGMILCIAEMTKKIGQ
jgi:hypothetical protein